MQRSTRVFDAVIVGAGFAGMYMLYRLRNAQLNVRVIERGDDVGGTWYWNRYPGARCDVESVEYSYSFSDELQQEWQWSERYSGQPEILRYANHVADRFGLRRDIQFNTSAESAYFDEHSQRWHVKTDKSDELECQFLIMATGCLSSANTPSIEGIESFEGAIYHTGNWPHQSVDFAGTRVGIIGTGSSAIQAIPHIAKQAAQLTVFQRTPNFSVPARNRKADSDEVAAVKENYSQFRKLNKMMPAALGASSSPNNTSALDATPEEHQREFEKRWKHGGFAFMGAFNDLGLNKDANEIAAEFVRGRIREIVDDSAIAKTLSPDSVLGCKRLCLDSDYFETYNQENVSLIDINKTPIRRITQNGIETSDRNFTFDAIVFATGFDAMTGTLLRIDIRGKAGLTLREKWQEGPKTYLGLTTAGFPNLFMISGPGSPSVLTNMIMSIEQHVEWIDDCITYMHDHKIHAIDAEEKSEEDWVDYVNAVANMTLYPTCNSWYLGANIPGKPRVFMPHVGFPTYVQKCNEVVEAGYRGFKLL